MVSSTHTPPSRIKIGEPVWDIARLYPPQGQWRERDYFHLESKHRAEFTDGCVEFLPVPTIKHQAISMFLVSLLNDLVAKPDLGMVLFSGTRVRIRPGMYREPDVLVLLAPCETRLSEEYLEQPDIVFEIVSKDDPKRDFIEKRADYAEGCIPEYWIIDPRDESVTVLTLQGKAYVEHGRHLRGQQATSKVLPQFIVDVAAVFNAGRPTAS